MIRLGSRGNVFVALLWATVSLCAGCTPLTDQGSIRADVDPESDPAVRRPHLAPGAPASADTAVYQGPTGPPVKTFQAPPGYQSLDPADPAPLVEVRIDGRRPTVDLGGKTVRLAEPASLNPTVMFLIDPRMGEFRGAAIQVFQVVDGRPVPASGVRLQSSGAGSPLAPGRMIRLTELGEAVTVRQIASGQPQGRLALEPGCEYEIQFLIGATNLCGATAVRIRTAAPPPPATATGPTTQGDPDQPDPAGLPPGVTIPGP